MGLGGREAECSTIDALLASARQGFGGALVIRGEPGIGKTVLLDYAVGAAADFLVVRMTGIESERELPFAALHRLLTPIVHEIERLPTPQRDALSSALGLAAGPPADRFLVGLATISLAAHAARAAERLLCVVDDAQWLDRESLEALAFWGRRIDADGIAVIFAERDESTTTSPLEGFPVLHVRGLADIPARALLASEARFEIDREVADRIVADTGGNPLAIVEIAKDLTADQLIGAAAVPQPLPVSRRLEQRFLRLVRSLPVETQMLMLLCAADATGDAKFLWRAASIVGVNPEAADAAEAEGLLILGSHVTFRHPLIRSAVYAGARPADRRAIHRALASASDPQRDSDRRAWHLAAASVGRDEEVAALLERCAITAGERGGHAAKVAFLSRAAELTPDPERAGRRRVAAAEAALAGGAPLQTHALIALAMPDLTDPADRAYAQRLEGCAWTRLGRAAIAAPILLSASVALLETDLQLGRQTLLDTLEATFLSEGMTDVSQAAAAVAHSYPTSRSTVVDQLLDGFATYVSAGYVAAVPLFRSVIATMTDEDVRAEDLIRWAILASNATRALWDYDAYEQLMARLARVSRERGALPWLAVALQACATTETSAGRFAAAEAYLAQAADVSSAAGGSRLITESMGLWLLANRGRDADVIAKASVVMTLATEMGLGSATTLAHRALMLLDLGRGRYTDALAHATWVFDEAPVGASNEVLPDMIEAAVRAGDQNAADKAMDRLAERAPASGTPWAMALLARSRALLAGDDGETLYKEAIDLLGSTRLAVEVARTHLLYGEWLRRENRRLDARDELRVAYDMFATIGAEAFMTRARDELLATGEHVRKRAVETSNDLTPQEAHIAELAAERKTNAEIAAQLYISERTVEYHLRKVFRKLAVSSRRQLKRALVNAP